MRFHHIGIACLDIKKELDEMAKIFGEPVLCKVFYDPLQRAELCMAEFNGLNIELVAGEVVKNLVAKGIKVYHICYEVKDLESAIQELTEKGGMLISPPKEAVMFNHRRVAFVMLKTGLILELLEVGNA